MEQQVLWEIATSHLCRAMEVASGVILSAQIFSNSRLLTFAELQGKFGLPQMMHFPYLQLQHAIKAQTVSDLWTQCPAPVFHYMIEVSYFKGFISRVV